MFEDVNFYRSHNPGLQKHGEHTAIERETSCRPMLGFCLHETFCAFLFGTRESTRSFSAFDELGITDTVILSRFR